MGEMKGSVPAASRPYRTALKWATAFTVFVVALAGAGVYFGWPRLGGWVGQRLVDTAAQRGVVLELSDVEVSLRNIHLRDARARLEGVEGLTAYLQTVDVGLSGFKPNRIQIEGVVVQASGSPLDLRRAVQAWRSRHSAPAAFNVPPKPEIRNIKFTWQALANTAPFLELNGVTFSEPAKPYGPIGEDVAVQAERAQVGKLSMAPLAVVVHNEAESVEIGLGGTDWEGLTTRGGWKYQANSDELHLSFGPVAVGPFLQMLGVSLPDRALAAAMLCGGITLQVPRDEHNSYRGYWALDVKGWTPPHPAELQGFPFGSSTRLDSTFELDRALTAANLPSIRLTSGAFKLLGHARANRSSLTSARVQAELKGHIPCTAFAGAAATSKLGQAYGQWVSQHAGQLVEGNVDVTVQMDADTSAIGRAKVVQQMGVGCGLKSQTIQQLLALGLPPMPNTDLINHLEKDLPSWGGQLPLVPSFQRPFAQPPDWTKRFAQ